MSSARQWLPRSIECLRGYTMGKFSHDLVAGVTVGLVALPLAMAFAIASGVSPQAGLYTAVVAGWPGTPRRTDGCWVYPHTAKNMAARLRELLEAGSNGVIYRSVRHAGGECLACFRPTLVANVRSIAHFEYRWTGTRTPQIRKLPLRG